MSQQFQLALVNPDIASGDAATIYTGLASGNKLNLVLTNNSGYPMVFTGDQDLLVKFPSSIMDEAGISAITVSGGWTTNGYYTPTTDPNTSDKGAYYILRLKASGQGVAFADSGTITIALGAVKPSGKGNASIFTTYNFSDYRINMAPSASLAAIGQPEPDQKPLLGSENALLLTVRVNNGANTNPLIYNDSQQPVTASNAAENLIHINFDFQDQNLPSGPSKDGLGALVDGWDPEKPPTFQIQFPYFNAQSPFAAPYDLTDDRRQGDAGYNAYTSAWNIQLSLSATSPSVLSNDWWVITPPSSDSSEPVWLIQPTKQNKYMFTGTTQGTNASGPFLDLFFSHIYSNLVIDPSHPETILYVETYNVPGFSDHLTQMPLFKEPSVRITSFTGQIQEQGGVSSLLLSWQTENADYCTLNNSVEQLQANGNYPQAISLINPLLSSYTVTAHKIGSKSSLQQTIFVQWQESTSVSPSSYPTPGAIQVLPDGSSVYLTSQSAVNCLSSTALVPTKAPLDVSPNFACNLVMSSRGDKMYLGERLFNGTGAVVAYDTGFTPLSVPAASTAINGASNLFPMALSDDGSQVVINMAFPADPNGPRLQAYNTSTMQPSQGSPYSSANIRGVGLTVSGNNIYYPDSNGLGVLNRATLQPVTGSPVSLKSNDNATYYPGPIAISPDKKTAATLALGYINGQRAFVLCTVDLQRLALKKRVQVSTGYSNAPLVVSTGLLYSVDGQYLFGFGVDYSSGVTSHTKTIVNVYDPDTLQELPWSPIDVSAFYGSMAMAPDGSKIYASTLDSSTATQGSVRMIVPYFPS